MYNFKSYEAVQANILKLLDRYVSHNGSEEIQRCNNELIVNIINELLDIDADKSSATVWESLSENRLLKAFLQFLNLDGYISRDRKIPHKNDGVLDINNIDVVKSCGWNQAQFLILELFIFLKVFVDKNNLPEQSRKFLDEELRHMRTDSKDRLDTLIINEIFILIHAYNILVSYTSIMDGKHADFDDPLKNLYTQYIETIVPLIKKGYEFCVPCGSKTHAVYLILFKKQNDIYIRVDDSSLNTPIVLLVPQESIRGPNGLISYMVEVAFHANQPNLEAMSTIYNRKSWDLTPIAVNLSHEQDSNFEEKQSQTIDNCVYRGYIRGREYRIVDGLKAKAVFDWLKEEEKKISIVNNIMKPRASDWHVMSVVGGRFINGVTPAKETKIITTLEDMADHRDRHNTYLKHFFSTNCTPSNNAIADKIKKREYTYQKKLSYEAGKSSHIVDRSELIERFNSLIKTGIHFVGIHGLAGAGKTQLSYEFTRLLIKEFSKNNKKLIVYEFSLEDTSDSALCNQYATFIDTLKLGYLNDDISVLKSKNREELFNIIKIGLNVEYADSSVLFIYDNVDDDSDVEYINKLLISDYEWFNQKCFVLATSQKEKIFNNVKDKEIMNLNIGLTLKQALSLLKKEDVWCFLTNNCFVSSDSCHSGHIASILTSMDLDKKIPRNDNVHDVLSLITLFEGLPLGLFIASHYLQNNKHVNIKRYISEIQQTNRRFHAYFEAHLRDQYNKINCASCQISAIIHMILAMDKQYEHDYKDAKIKILPSETLQYLSLFSNAKIPFLLVSEIIQSQIKDVQVKTQVIENNPNRLTGNDNNSHDFREAKNSVYANLIDEIRDRFFQSMNGNSLVQAYSDSEIPLGNEYGERDMLLSLHGQTQLAARCLLLESNHSGEIKHHANCKTIEELTHMLKMALQAISSLQSSSYSKRYVQFRELLCKHFFELVSTINKKMPTIAKNVLVLETLNNLIGYFIENNYSQQMLLMFLGVENLNNFNGEITNKFNLSILVIIKLFENLIRCQKESGGKADVIPNLLFCLELILSRVDYFNKMSESSHGDDIAKIKKLSLLDVKNTVRRTGKIRLAQKDFFTEHEISYIGITLCILRILSLLDLKDEFQCLYRSNIWSSNQVTTMQKLEYRMYLLNPIMSDEFKNNFQKNYKNLRREISMLDERDEKVLLLSNLDFKYVLLEIECSHYDVASEVLESLYKRISEDEDVAIIPYVLDIQIARVVVLILKQDYQGAYNKLKLIIHALPRKNLYLNYLLCVLYAFQNKLVVSADDSHHLDNISECFHYVSDNTSLYPENFLLLYAIYLFDRKTPELALLKLKDYFRNYERDEAVNVPMLNFTTDYSRREFYSQQNTLAYLSRQWIWSKINPYTFYYKILDDLCQYVHASEQKVKYLNYMYTPASTPTVDQEKEYNDIIKSIFNVIDSVDEVGLYKVFSALNNLKYKNTLLYAKKLTCFSRKYTDNSLLNEEEYHSDFKMFFEHTQSAKSPRSYLAVYDNACRFIPKLKNNTIAVVVLSKTFDYVKKHNLFFESLEKNVSRPHPTLTWVFLLAEALGNFTSRFSNPGINFSLLDKELEPMNASLISAVTSRDKKEIREFEFAVFSYQKIIKLLMHLPKTLFEFRKYYITKNIAILKCYLTSFTDERILRLLNDAVFLLLDVCFQNSEDKYAKIKDECMVIGFDHLISCSIRHDMYSEFEKKENAKVILKLLTEISRMQNISMMPALIFENANVIILPIEDFITTPSEPKENIRRAKVAVLLEHAYVFDNHINIIEYYVKFLLSEESDNNNDIKKSHQILITYFKNNPRSDDDIRAAELFYQLGMKCREIDSKNVDVKHAFDTIRSECFDKAALLNPKRKSYQKAKADDQNNTVDKIVSYQNILSKVKSPAQEEPDTLIDQLLCYYALFDYHTCSLPQFQSLYFAEGKPLKLLRLDNGVLKVIEANIRVNLSNAEKLIAAALPKMPNGGEFEFLRGIFGLRLAFSEFIKRGNFTDEIDLNLNNAKTYFSKDFKKDDSVLTRPVDGYEDPVFYRLYIEYVKHCFVVLFPQSQCKATYAVLANAFENETNKIANHTKNSKKLIELIGDHLRFFKDVTDYRFRSDHCFLTALRLESKVITLVNRYSSTNSTMMWGLFSNPRQSAEAREFVSNSLMLHECYCSDDYFYDDRLTKWKLLINKFKEFGKNSKTLYDMIFTDPEIASILKQWNGPCITNDIERTIETVINEYDPEAFLNYFTSSEKSSAFVISFSKAKFSVPESLKTQFYMDMITIYNSIQENKDSRLLRLLIQAFPELNSNNIRSSIYLGNM